MNYWLNLYTWKTWNEFLASGGHVTGFRANRWATVQRMKPDDILLGYMTGISRFFAVQEVIGEPFQSDEEIWEDVPFPCRVPIKILLAVDPEYAVPVKSLSDELSYFQDMKSPHAWTGHFRGSPTREHPADAQVIIAAIEEAKANPVRRSYDERKLHRDVPIFETKNDAVTIPDSADEGESVDQSIEESPVTHEEIQWLLLKLGNDMGLDVWVASNDRSKSYDGNAFTDLARLRDALPIQFDAATNRTIELIDVLWLRENSIEAAFEVEHTTSIYSGLLRMSDLISMQPNLNIRLYIVAPDERRSKVLTEVNRPTFTRLKPPLRELCEFISYSTLREHLDRVSDYISVMKPEFLDKVSESLDPEV